MAEKVWSYDGTGWSSSVPVDGTGTGGAATILDVQLAVANRAKVDSNGNVLTGDGSVVATQTFVDQRIAEALAQNPSVPDNIQQQLDSKVSNTALSNIQYTLIVPLGETGPSTRPAEAGNRPILQKGGPMPLPWIDRSKGDDWLGVLNA
ncbi:hypothetical protein FDO65_10195 [Nakamurella flava]|uniref:Uncharacterized protein n=1 Tax=Nakamurella flava TaxID=2576308 RepID=A0A4V6CSJ9_9ACTN|nr:hypothetical protein [Nakamurella flava]TKV61885.1 hypothetical protein FDO65_10195 [Nakamurella flava]